MATSTESEVDAQLRDARDGVQSLVARADTKAQALLSTLSRIAVGKFRLIRLSIALVVTGLVTTGLSFAI